MKLTDAAIRTKTKGLYPETTLAQARERHQDARKLLAEGVEPIL